MKKPPIKSRPSSQTLNKGLTLVEVLIALGIGLTIMAAAFSITSANKRLLTNEQNRTSLNQTARGAIELIGTDIRIAGERLSRAATTSVTAIEVIGGNELVLRRKLSEYTLFFCEVSLTKDSTESLAVSLTGNTNISLVDHPECTVIDNDSDNLPDDYEEWVRIRTEQGGKAMAYITTAGGIGEFFTYTSELEDTHSGKKRFNLRRSGTWINGYHIDDLPTIILLEEKRYKLNNGVLEVIVNGDTDNPLKIASGVKSLQFRVIDNTGTTFTNFDKTKDWRTIQTIEVTVQAKDTGNNTERTLTSRFLPRNVISK